jgi:HPt (histidine-containing phosphotransfer) domain-containing protein
MSYTKDQEYHFQLLQQNRLTLFAGSDNLMRECIDMFFRNSAGILEKIEEGIQEADYSKVRDQAHKLKGILKLFTDESTVTLCRELEQRASYNKAGELETTYSSLRDELGWVINSLHNYKSQHL